MGQHLRSLTPYFVSLPHPPTTHQSEKKEKKQEQQTCFCPGKSFICTNSEGCVLLRNGPKGMETDREEEEEEEVVAVVGLGGEFKGFLMFGHSGVNAMIPLMLI